MMKKLLQELSNTPSVSGNEHRIRDVIKNKVEETADEVEVDNMGNLIARKGEGDKTLMLAAHMDQIGLSVKRITEEGFVMFSAVGGVTRMSLLNQRVKIHGEDGEVTGVIGMKPPHLMEKDEREKVPEVKDLFIDIGAEDDEQVEEAGIKVGDFITFERSFSELQDGRVTGQAMDNRVGCAVAITALERFDEDYELVVVFSTQEEVGLKGARTAAYGEAPDVALAIDVSIAGDVPGIQDNESNLSIGDGAEITMLQSNGRGIITPETIRNWLVDTAEDNGIDYLLGVWEGGATDAAGIELTKEGIPTGSVGIPLRNMHSAIEVVDIADMGETVDLLEDSFGTLRDYF